MYIKMTFKKVYCLKPLTTYINEENEEKKLVKGLLPPAWNEKGKEYDYNNVSNYDRGFGFIVKTGKTNGITVLDFDTMETYIEACTVYPKLHEHFTVQTRKGRHVYFTYDETIDKYQVPKVDTQSDGKCVFGVGTTVTRYNGEQYKYTYLGGHILPMPVVLRKKCSTKDDQKDDTRAFTFNVNYDYEISDEQIIEIVEQLKIKHPEYLTDYNLWLKFTTVMKTINKFELWDKTNRQFCETNRQFKKNIPNMVILKHGTVLK